MRERLRFCPRTPFGRSGLTAKRHVLCAPPLRAGRGNTQAESGAPWVRCPQRDQQQRADPLPEPVSRAVARCTARARDGDGGVVQECRRPNAGSVAPAGARPKGRAGPSATVLTGPLPLLGQAMSGTAPTMGITSAGIANVDDRQACGDDDLRGLRGGFRGGMVC